MTLGYRVGTEDIVIGSHNVQISAVVRVGDNFK
mgnify:CR=1 FL=1|jgi:hypothetical protein